MTIADTDVLIDYLAGRGAAEVVERLIRSGALKTTVITRFELLSGGKNARQRTRLRQLLAAIAVARTRRCRRGRGQRSSRSLEESGNPIGMADSLIAGIVTSNDGTLLTRNRRHFERVPGLKLA